MGGAEFFTLILPLFTCRLFSIRLFYSFALHCKYLLNRKRKNLHFCIEMKAQCSFQNVYRAAKEEKKVS